MDGYALTGIPLLAYDGKRFLPAGFSDDPGIYYFAPWIARAFGISIERSVTLLLLSAGVMGFGIGLAGFMCLFRNSISRMATVLALGILTALSVHVGDVYVVEFATCVGVLPWLLYFSKKGTTSRAFLIVVLPLGVILGLASLIRSSSASPILIMALILLTCYAHANAKQKAALIVCLLLGYSAPRLYCNHLLQTRDGFLRHNVSGYAPGSNRHVIGHFAYAGMGFLSNPYVPAVSDEVSKNRVRAISPNSEFLSSEYDRILLRESASLAVQHPYLAVCTILAKLGVIVGVIVLFANLGLLAAIRYPKSWKVEVAFWAGFAISAAPLVLFAPNQQYIVGLVSLSVAYGLVSLDYGLNEMKSCSRTEGTSTIRRQLVTPTRREIELNEVKFPDR
jgi:hypothetical protein